LILFGRLCSCLLFSSVSCCEYICSSVYWLCDIMMSVFVYLLRRFLSVVSVLMLRLLVGLLSRSMLGLFISRCSSCRCCCLLFDSFFISDCWCCLVKLSCLVNWDVVILWLLRCVIFLMLVMVCMMWCLVSVLSLCIFWVRKVSCMVLLCLICLDDGICCCLLDYVFVWW